MENSFQIDVITPIKNINVGTSEYLRAPNLEGLFGIKARHVSSIISVGEGEIKITQDGKENFYLTTGGYADIKPEGVILVLETFEKK
jgi:F0F1-type ATP synthase epsilon subunit|tara:strand:+ start:261 stop:521 length:261 start_codon:yes stop_codon:yes gene_type:complete